ncbi:hypothetical protein [Serratia marcescens]|uniref:hypothetical protein n=1 Tax=Serratia marcescens TaxID=615 RepID=UPI0011541167|nr:hypothetical protein [Serratia marcescens]QDI41661.1 hypothetical protein FG172_05425 [Serratia marcescens]QDI56092.1 hypothetical protein FG175_05425 [Serratia marcescens]
MTLTTETLNLWRNNAEITAGETAEDDPEHIAAKAILALTAELLANREAQPVAVGKFAGWGLYHATDDRFSSWIHPQPRDQSYLDSLKPGYANIKLFTAPPAPAVPPEATPENIENLLADITLFFTAGSLSHGGSVMFAEVWNACRAAMLNHVGDANEKAAEKCECSSIDYCENCLRAMLAQPVSSGYKLPDNVREALTLALQAMEFMGDTLNNIDAVCTEDVEYVTPAFNAVRELLAAAPEGVN